MSKNERQQQKQNLPRRESQNPSPLPVSLDNADTVIEGGPAFAIGEDSETLRVPVIFQHVVPEK
jgi:hypothetical protein